MEQIAKQFNLFEALEGLSIDPESIDILSFRRMKGDIFPTFKAGFRFEGVDLTKIGTLAVDLMTELSKRQIDVKEFQIKHGSGKYGKPISEFQPVGDFTLYLTLETPVQAAIRAGDDEAFFGAMAAYFGSRKK